MHKSVRIQQLYMVSGRDAAASQPPSGYEVMTGALTTALLASEVEGFKQPNEGEAVHYFWSFGHPHTRAHWLAARGRQRGPGFLVFATEPKSPAKKGEAGYQIAPRP